MYVFSKHALDRIEERLTISPAWISRLLEKHSVEVTHLGCENLNNRHFAFWSIPDEAAFIAVADAVEGVVITIMPASPQTIRIHTNRDGTKYATRLPLRAIRQSMRLAGLKLPRHKVPGGPAKSERAYNQEFIARFLTRDGQAKTKLVGRASVGDDIDERLAGCIEKALELSEKHGTLGLTIELRNRDDFNVIQEWVLEESVAYGLD